MNVCRTCVSSTSNELVPIFSKLGDQFIANVIVDCSSVMIMEDDDLPSYICQHCLTRVQMIADFAGQVRESDRKLRQLFKSEVSLRDIEEDCNWGDEEPPSDTFSLHQVKLEVEIEKVEPLESEPESVLDFEDGNDSDWNGGEQKMPDDEVELGEAKLEVEEHCDLKEDGVPTKRPKRTRAKRKPKKCDDENDDDDQDDLGDVALTEKELKFYETIQIGPGRHICCWCCVDFGTKEELVTHGQIHFKTRAKRSRINKEHCCEICFVGFKRLKSLEDHVKLAAALSSKPIYQCKRCQSRFISLRRRRLHVIHHERDDERKGQKEVQLKQKTPKCCSWGCYKEFETEQQLLEHGQKEHIGKKRETFDPKLAHECPVCFKCVESAKSLYRHRDRIHTYAETTCSICGAQFRCRNSTIKHERRHNNERPYGCEICAKPFASVPALKEHMLVHNDEKPFVCSVCGWGFKRECNLKIHMLIHSEALPFKCDVCGKSFKGKYHLQYHMRTHTGTKPWKCKYCDKTFAHHANRTRHEISHTGVKPHKCSFCEKSFIRKRQLVEHESIHTGIEPYRCEMCNRTFGKKSELQKHLEVHPRAPENHLSLPVPSPMPATEAASSFQQSLHQY
ncbi:gastrula zinc finger protein XLCGF9.1 [Culex quinquefasciatus]|uniref:Gastrula zinc finger protein XLCGF9.1 n=1 Tax=Culex quinquefasciatus TaxID=7176 RepID=B0WG46_CULQU|nr:gastrula zinc finger protein XLCGF9.1 [Culex quinquefasciatus]|eukprot:XP_001847680.1 gastrula zinc finger protein XLCGF9.1 [Culex quinquefasciatus]